MEDTNPELERFRNQWREEVTARAKGAAQSGDGRPSHPSGLTKPSIKYAIPPPPPSAANTSDAHDEDEAEGLDPKTYHNLNDNDDPRSLDVGQEEPPDSGDGSIYLRSALEHYEKAMERETQGSLGDSLSLYRKAYRVCLNRQCLRIQKINQ